MRAITSLEIGVQAPERSAIADLGKGGRILLVDDRPSSYERLAPVLSDRAHRRRRAQSGRSAVSRRRRQLRPADRLAQPGEFRRAAAVQPGPLAGAHPQRADPGHRRRRQQRAPAARPRDRRQRLPAAPGRQERAVGARPHPDPQARYTDHLRDNVQNSIEMAITDALTGLHNRRYMESHLGTLAEQAATRGKPLALMMLDIDFFKSINDNYGHDAGDDVLREFAVRIRKSIRGIDLACRYGGEEFVIVMPETDLHVAGMVAERLRRSIAGEPFAVNKGATRIEVTISIGLSHAGEEGRAGRRCPQARRRRPLPRQARRPQPRGRRRGVRRGGAERALSEARSTTTTPSSRTKRGIQKPQRKPGLLHRKSSSNDGEKFPRLSSRGHCERSEAIQEPRRKTGLLRRESSSQ